MNITSSLASILNSSPRAHDALVRKGQGPTKSNEVDLQKIAEKTAKAAENISVSSLADKLHTLTHEKVMALLDPDAKQALGSESDAFTSLLNFPPASASDKLLQAWGAATEGFEDSIISSLQIDFSIEQVLANVKRQVGMIIGEHNPGEKEFRDIFSEENFSYQQVTERVMIRLEIASEFGSIRMEEFSEKKVMIQNFQQQLDSMGIE